MSLKNLLTVFKQNNPGRLLDLLPTGFYPYPDGITDPWTAPFNHPTTDNISSFLTPFQLERTRHDLSMWREAVREAELAFYPHRVRMQRMYIDTILNPHVQALMQKRINLTLLRDFEIVDATGKKSDTLTEMFKAKWFYDYLRYTVESVFFGYSLIQLGDLINGEFSDISIVRRHNISPDRKQVAIYMYAITGMSIDDEKFAPWLVWTPTSTEFGVSPCGYGLLYKIADIEILHRNTIIANADFCDLFGKPYRHAKTDLKGQERNNLETSMDRAGINQWIVTDKQTEIEWLQSNGAGSSIYRDFREDLEGLMSKLLCGHKDVMNSVPSKMGNSGKSQPGGAMTPEAQALSEIQTVDGRFVEHNVNHGLIPKMNGLGFKIPDGFKFKFTNDDELVEARMLNDNNNLITATVAQTLKAAGFAVDPKYLAELMQMPITAAPTPTPGEEGNEQDTIADIIRRQVVIARTKKDAIK